MTCEDCRQATTTWHWGGIHDGCRGCMVRTIAKSPSSVRARLYQIERDQNGEGASLKLKADATAEWNRIKDLKERP